MNPTPTPRIFLRPYRGGYACVTLIPRVPLRSTRGYSPQPLWGQDVYSGLFSSPSLTTGRSTGIGYTPEKQAVQ